jgi:hypothetical protein
MEEKITERLKGLLHKLEDWQKAPTSVQGVSIIKIPAKKDTPARLGIEINPVDVSGKPIKKSGAIVITNLELFDMYSEIFENFKVKELIHEIEVLRKEIYPTYIEKNEDGVFEI